MRMSLPFLQSTSIAGLGVPASSALQAQQSISRAQPEIRPVDPQKVVYYSLSKRLTITKGNVTLIVNLKIHTIMKQASALLLFIAFLASPAVLAQAPANHLEGSWRIVSQRSVYPDTVIITLNVPPSIKILNSTHFSWGYQSANGAEVLAGGGRYTLEDDTLYTEYLEYHTSEALVGVALRFSARVVGDLWYHVGEFPSGYRLEEVWRRIE